MLRFTNPMTLNLISEHAGEIPLSPITPTMLWEYKLPDTACLVAAGHYGNFLLQEMAGTGYSIWYNTYQLPKRDTIIISDDQALVRIPIILKNSFFLQQKELGDWPMHERAYHIYYTPSLQTRMRLQKEKLYSSFELCLQPDYLAPLAFHYPVIALLLENAQKAESTMATGGPFVATPAMMSIVRNILNNTYTGPLRQLYLDTRVGELVILALHQAANHANGSPVKLTEDEVESIYETKALLVKQLDKSLSIEQLSKKRGLTAHKLKKGFQRIYGVGVFDFLLEARMERAGALLHETHIPVEHVARLTGYKNIANFSVVFKKYYGYPPRWFRGK